MTLEKFCWLTLILFFGIIVFVNSPRDFTDLGGDSAQYIILAESIAKGLGFKAVNLPHSPFFYHFPPLFPLILSFIIYFFGRNFYLGVVFIKRGTLWNELLSFVFISLIFSGIWVSIRTRQKYCFFYYFFLYLFLIILWPFKEGLRFLLPVLPFFYFYLFKGVERIFQKRVVFLSFFFILFFINLITLSRLSSSKNLSSPLKNFILIHQWIKKNLPDKGIIISCKPTVTYFFTQHKSIVYPFSSPEEIWEKIKKEKVKYIIIDEFSYQTYYYLLPFIYKYRKNLKLLYRIGNTEIVEVIKK